ncbi:MAG: WD40 repeat domain-containing protein [Planctomycetes bacterium]|nr:WD40 repeat domain-containing protein [Planctomycetota bacterium]
MISANAHFLIAAVLSLAGADEKPRVDLYGDPLPEGAVLRLGTVRLRHPGVLAIAFSADGRKLISFGGDRVIRTWDPVTGRQMEDKPLPEVYDTPVAALSPDGNWLAFRDTSNKKGLYLWDVQKHQLAHKFLLKASCWDSPVAFSLDGATLVTTQKDGDVRAWDVKSGNAKLVGHLDGDIQHLSFARDGKLMTINKDPQGAPDSVKIRVWNLRDNTEPLTINLKMGLIQFQVDAHISPDAKFIAIRDLWSNSLSFWDTSTGKKANDWKSPEAPAYGVPRFSPDGKTTFIGTDNVVMWDPIEGKATRTLPGGTSANLIVSPDGKTAAATAADGYDAVVYLWDLTGGRRSPANDPERGHLDRVDAVALSKDGRTIATGSSRGVFLWDASTGRSLRKLSELATPDALTFSQDGRFLFVMTGEWIDQFDIASGEKIRCFAPEKAQVGLSEMNLSIDGKRLVALGYTGSPGDCRCLFITWEVS